VVLFPLVLGVLVVWHVLLVRRRGVVPPFEDGTAPATEPAPEPAPEEVAS
jgi:ubiquinol-cytochrome c reductase cytochrome b subunit